MGIRIMEARSIPFDTPRATIATVIVMNAKWWISSVPGELKTASKRALAPAASCDGSPCQTVSIR